MRAASASLAQRPLEHPFRAEIGVFTPHPVALEELGPGEVGFLAANVAFALEREDLGPAFRWAVGLNTGYVVVEGAD